MLSTLNDETQRQLLKIIESYVGHVDRDSFKLINKAAYQVYTIRMDRRIQLIQPIKDKLENLKRLKPKFVVRDEFYIPIGYITFRKVKHISQDYEYYPDPTFRDIFLFIRVSDNKVYKEEHYINGKFYRIFVDPLYRQTFDLYIK